PLLGSDDIGRGPSHVILLLLGRFVTNVGGASLTTQISERFTIDVPDAILSDLRDRLARTRWPDQLPGTGWDYGTDTAYLRELADYWQNDFDWRAQEARLNQFDHFRARVGDMRIHFIHARSPSADAIPLLMLHGWPSSFVQMLDIVP